MSIDIEILNGNAAWPAAEPLLNAVWPSEIKATRPWGEVTFAHADFRVLVEADDAGLVCHVGLYRRHATFNGRAAHVGGIGGVATRADHRRRGLATIALNAAIQTFRHEGSLGFALLFCEAATVPFYQARGWHLFEGEILAEQPAGHGRFDVLVPMVFDLVQKPRKGVIDLRGLPW
ncbi:GNAT family N-acetyltransferase [Bradyrhizobium sp. U87765 SZCCT0131]|uniref:GNAT family N-acetyltransferase n=1 Tax=unclassified Bradyrhizobium TaxID=2631580 RepID=UPI001BAB4113|nr:MULTISPECIES: GNAT family N-acetyltransferase [unclassified Bradyrhizobium]MBR1218745.1 GNAT family N-acetyltransferase [Bradyrhizobium sp. U87765 SZCCT0131]MBR1265496.1 GNAT family N-acetyltransferase [Bradyrhizobium sp. U87765 SZCCT0134]MBR1304244.1 GNAT family N-acetyltransferase [Bradyrhizobium sp. U87765 SZCCT0110]MBR1319849.1 GNAT family N-acetyltransferase [Bradyrhizobium sp. U87765 SZCCT0109]MBR1348175.1 GNAT family N-acetyltransferase [Bradyrhizobium sp. U87765 SZCCT0048]